MRQFCGALEDCCFGADMVCVYCERKAPGKALVKRDHEDELEKEAEEDTEDSVCLEDL